MKSDIEIARECRLKPIEDIARQVQIPVDELEHYGKYIAKVPESLIDEKKVENSNLILVTAITPTKAGIGKTTVSVGLALGLSHIGKKNIVALREPSLGPCFGLKGGAAGGGYAQILPMDKINLHFTGDFHAVTSAHNMIAALLDNYIYQHRDEGFAMKEILWKRVLDINDRNLRYVVTGLGAKTNGVTMESGFDITPASEIMAILCLSKDEHDLRRRIENSIVGHYNRGKNVSRKRHGSGRGNMRTFKRRLTSQFGANHGKHTGYRARRTFCQYRTRVQLHISHQTGYDVRGLCGDGGRFRGRFGGGKVLQYQMPEVRFESQTHHTCRYDPRFENARWGSVGRY